MLTAHLFGLLYALGLTLPCIHREEVSLLDLHGHVEELEGSRATEADAMKELQPALETTVTQLAQSLSEGLANVSDAQVRPAWW